MHAHLFAQTGGPPTTLLIVLGMLAFLGIIVFSMLILLLKQF